MKTFKVSLFTQGRMIWRGEVPASTHKMAITLASPKAGMSYTHAVVLGEKVARRYNRNFKPISGGIRMFKSYLETTPAILLMVGRLAEFYRFESDEKRNEAYEFLCTPSIPAESVKADEEPTDIIVLSEETSASRSGLMSKKIWNGSVTNATWQDWLTQSSIESSFGNGNADVTEKNTWSSGSKASPSNQTPTFLATVLNTGEGDDSFTPLMKDMVGQTIRVTKVHDGLYKGSGWFWKAEWLDLENVYVTVKHPVNHNKDGVYFTPSMQKTIGETYHMTYCAGTDPAHYNFRYTWCFAQEWLEPAHKNAVKKADNKMEAINNAVSKVIEEIAPEKKVIVNPEKAWKEYVTSLNPKVKKDDLYTMTSEPIDFKKAALKWSTLPFAADDDEPISTAVDPATIKPPTDIEEFKAITKKLKKMDYEAMMESPWLKLDKYVEEDVKNIEEDKLKFKYMYGIVGKPKKNPYFNSGGS